VRRLNKIRNPNIEARNKFKLSERIMTETFSSGTVFLSLVF